MRKIIAIISLVVILFNIGGYFLYFTYLKSVIQKDIKAQIRKGLKEEDLTLIVVTDEISLKWLKEGKEFSCNGDMFDVVKKKTEGDSTYYYCINDTKEKHLIADFLKTDKAKQRSDNILKKVISIIYLPSKFETTQIIDSGNYQFNFTDSVYQSIKMDVTLPPPKAA